MVYGFIGLTVGKPLFLKMGVSTGSCVLLAAVLLSKGETIASLIALEMGSAKYHSLHYHALYASGLVLLLLIALIHLLVKMGERPRTSKFTSRAGSPDPITAKFTSRAGSPNPITAKSLSVYSVENREEATPHLLATGKRAEYSPPSPVLWPFPLRLWCFRDFQAFLPLFSWFFMQRKAEKKECLHFFIHLLSGVPSIVLGLFSYSLFV